MTFTKFEEIIKKHRPEIEVTPHGFHTSRVNIGVCFKKGGKAYSYSGSYCDVLNRLGIKAITKSDYAWYERRLRYYEETAGELNPFNPNEIDYNEKEIAEIKSELARFDKEFEII